MVKCLAWLLQYKGPAMTIAWESFQKQFGFSDCGVFAIAAATALCNGLDPSACQWIQADMRSHLEKCFSVGKMVPFPSSKRRRKGTQNKRISTHKLYCICRQPDLPDASQGRMAMCHVCREWMHESCENMPNAVFTEKHYKFTCNTCDIVL